MNKEHKIFTYLFLIFMLILTLLPLIFALSGSFKTNSELSSGGINIIPDSPTLNNYKIILGEGNFIHYALNTLEVAFVNCILSVFFISMAAYSFKRGNFAGKKILLAIVLAPLFLCSGTLSLFPLIKIAAKTGFCNKYGLGIILFIQNLPLLLFLNIGFLNSISQELDYAARIDGCSFFGTWWRVILPVSRPMTAMIILLSACNSIKDFLLSKMILLSNSTAKTMAVAVVDMKYAGGSGAAEYNILLAASILSLLPLILIFMFFNKYFMTSVMSGSLD